MGSYKDKKSLGLFGDGDDSLDNSSTKMGSPDNLRHTLDTFEYSTKGALGMDNHLQCLDTFSAATVESVPQSFVDYQLQALHEELVALPVPDRFLSLLDKLESKEDKGS